MKIILLPLVMFSFLYFSSNGQDVGQDCAPFTQLGWDIDGEESGDYSGWSVSLSNDGSRVAIGAPQNEGNGSSSGQVRVYEYNGEIWAQVGDDIDGESSGDESGESVSLSGDGSVVAIGASRNDQNGSSSGHVRLYEYDGTNWVQLGDDIVGESSGDYSGRSVSLSDDGQIIAIGAPSNDGNGNSSGHVRVYNYNGVDWVQLGNDIDGEESGDYSGYSISLNAEGRRLAIGSRHNDGAYNNSGHVRVYDYNGVDWVQLGNDIDGNIDNAGIGSSLSLSGNGKIVAVLGSTNFSVYEYIGSSWIQMGEDNPVDGLVHTANASVSINYDGTILAIGASDHSAGASDYPSGYAVIYYYDGSNWLQLETDIEGESTGDMSGHSVSLSSDGNRVAIGAYLNDWGGVSNSGHVRVYDLITDYMADVVVCDSFDWNGQSISTSGSYEHIFTDDSGCSSLQSINVFIPDPLQVDIIINEEQYLEVDTADTYLWNTGEMTQSIIPSENGEFWCVVTDENGCVSDTAYYNYQLFDLIENQDFFHMYPNPTHEHLTMESSLKIHSIKVMDVSGSFIDIDWHGSKVDVNKLVTGLYFIEVFTDKGAFTKQFVKE